MTEVVPDLVALRAELIAVARTLKSHGFLAEELQVKFDELYASYTAVVNARLRDEFLTGGDSYARHSATEEQREARSRDLMDKVVSRFDAEMESLPHVGDTPQFVLLVGAAGIGKSKLVESGRLAHDTKLPVNHMFHLDHDRIKKAIRKAGLGVEVEGLSPQETSPLLHRESMIIAHELLARAIEQRRHVICDWGSPADPDELEHAARFARRHGYELHVVELEAEPGISEERVALRHVAKMRPSGARSGRYVAANDAAAVYLPRPLYRPDGSAITTTLGVVANRLREQAVTYIRYVRSARGPSLAMTTCEFGKSPGASPALSPKLPEASLTAASEPALGL